MNPNQPFEPPADQDPVAPPPPVVPDSQPPANPQEGPVPPNPVTPPTVRPQVVRPSGVGWLRPAVSGPRKRKKLVVLVGLAVLAVLAIGGYFLLPTYILRQNTGGASKAADTFMDGLVAGDYEKVTSVYSGRDLKRQDVEASKSESIEKSPRLGLDVKFKDKQFKAVATYKLTIKDSTATTAYIVVLLGKDSGQWKVKNLVPSFGVEPKADVDSYNDANFAGGILGGQQTQSNTRQNDVERETDIKALHGQIEAYYAQNGRYPTLAQINDTTFRASTLKGLDADAFKDPAGSSKTLSDKPAKNVYAYQVTGDGGATCNNQSKDCTAYTLTATKDDGTTYVKKALN